MKVTAAESKNGTSERHTEGAENEIRKGEHHAEKQNPEVENENLGLDADHSSEPGTDYRDLNHDNDRISGNPDGESDHSEGSGKRGYSPLMDK